MLAGTSRSIYQKVVNSVRKIHSLACLRTTSWDPFWAFWFSQDILSYNDSSFLLCFTIFHNVYMMQKGPKLMFIFYNFRENAIAWK